MITFETLFRTHDRRNSTTELTLCMQAHARGYQNLLLVLMQCHSHFKDH